MYQRPLWLQTTATPQYHKVVSSPLTVSSQSKIPASGTMGANRQTDKQKPWLSVVVSLPASGIWASGAFSESRHKVLLLAAKIHARFLVPSRHENLGGQMIWLKYSIPVTEDFWDLWQVCSTIVGPGRGQRTQKELAWVLPVHTSRLHI